MRCPQCAKALSELSRRCPYCMADLDLLVDYVSDLQVGLDRAEQFTKNGELGLAVWSYLEVLEIDPNNPTAREQVGQVATAVRQFDRVAPGRRWHQGPATGWFGEAFPGKVLLLVGIALVGLFTAFAIGYGLGHKAGPEDTTRTPELEKPAKPKNTLGG
jgi:hypothetical protein